MKKRIVLLLIMSVAMSAIYAQTAEELLNKVDNDQVYDSIHFLATMTNVNQKSNRTEVKTFEAWERGTEDSLIVFTNSEDKGIKYLKKNGDYLYYSPDNEKWIVLPEHMTKNLMGSALSYDDTVEDQKLAEGYNAVIARSDTWDGKPVWVLDLHAKDVKKESYARRMLWIDKATGDLLHYELYALNGQTILKDYTILKRKPMNGRNIAVKGEITDRQNRIKTTFAMDESTIQMDQPIPDSVFTARN